MTHIKPLVLLLCSVFLFACGGGSNDKTASSAARQADATVASWQPLPKASQVSPEVAEARLRLLGPDSTNPNQVKVWWYGVSSFIASVGGHLILLDAWEVVGVHKNYVPITRDDLVALKPEAIFIGHGHFDHAADAGYVASRTGAVLVAGSSVCDTARRKTGQNAANTTFSCLRLGLAQDHPAGSIFPVKLFADLPPVNIIKHTHSAADPMDLLMGGTPLVYVPEVLPFLLNLNTDPQEILTFIQSLPEDGIGGEPEGGTWAYQFRVGDFSLLWHDSTGEMREGDPESEAIQHALANLPGCVDVQIGAIVGFGMLTSAYRDALAYVRAAQPRLFIPNHHDAWLPVIGGGASSYEAQWTSELATLAVPPEQDYLSDPQDYMKVRSFNVADARWRAPVLGRNCGR